MKNSEKSTGGLWMLVGMVVLLAAPMIIGHYALPAETNPTLHASID